jgi:nitrite reductase/ring-hydroxylating ferredoxin subunit
MTSARIENDTRRRTWQQPGFTKSGFPGRSFDKIHPQDFDYDMNINRRQFIVLSAATLATGCAANQPVHLQTASIDAGPATDFAADGVYSQFRSQGFFVIRKGSGLTAISSICTHRGCKVNVQEDKSFSCPCHGSDYDAGGNVTNGPAIHPLPTLPTTIDASGHLIIQATAV